MQNKRFDKWNIVLYTLIAVIIVGFVVFYYTVQNVCADEIIESCTPTIPVPTATYVPDSKPTLQPTDPQVTPTLTPTTIEATPTAGQSATMPLNPPDTGRGE